MLALCKKEVRIFHRKESAGTPVGQYMHVIRLSVDPCSALVFFHWMPSFSQLCTQWPPIFAFSIKIFWRNHQVWKNFASCSVFFFFFSFFRVLKLPRFCAILNPMTPFSDLSPNDPLFCKKIVLMALDLMHW